MMFNYEIFQSLMVLIIAIGIQFIAIILLCHYLYKAHRSIKRLQVSVIALSQVCNLDDKIIDRFSKLILGQLDEYID